MTDKILAPSMPGRNRPELSCGRLGYPPEVGDAEWNKKHKKYWRKLPNGSWEKK